jgi:hypothetical protein
VKPTRTGGRGRKLALLPLFGVLFWITSIAASTIPGLLVLGVNVHGLSLASYAGDPVQHLAPLSEQVVRDLQRGAQGGAGPSPTPTSTARPSDPRTSPASSPSPTPPPSTSPLPLPSATPLPSILPTPTPTPSPTKAAISGQVIDTVTRLPIVGATISLSPGGATTLTDVNGNFSFGVNAGTYTVTASATGYSSSSQTVTVNGGQNLGVTFKLVSLAATGGIKGSVTNRVTSAGIAGSTVTMSNGLVNVTDVNGAFSFPVVLYGTYTIMVSAIGYVSQTQSVTVKPGHTTTINFQLVP